MHTYLILQNPGHNRVYYNLAGKLALAELSIASSRLTVECTNISIKQIAEIRYVSFECDAELKDTDLQIISRLSFVFALYKLSSSKPISLVPIARYNYEYINDKISSLLKYPGKTNELFTKMMVNVALLSSDFSYDHQIKLLDPVAGKGTTLYEGSIYGFDCTGIEIEPKSVHDASVFFKKYLQEERLKHKIEKRQIFGKNKSEAIYIEEFEYARNKEDFKNKSARKTLGMVNGESQMANSYFKANSFHLIAGDLPYGIAHGNKGAKKSTSITRNPSELLSLCLPQWHKVLKKGGTVVLAWNAFVAAKEQLHSIFLDNGFELMKDNSYNQFEHMVDKSIKRDIIVAKKI